MVRAIETFSGARAAAVSIFQKSSRVGWPGLVRSWDGEWQQKVVRHRLPFASTRMPTYARAPHTHTHTHTRACLRNKRGTPHKPTKFSFSSLLQISLIPHCLTLKQRPPTPSSQLRVNSQVGISLFFACYCRFEFSGGGPVAGA